MSTLLIVAILSISICALTSSYSILNTSSSVVNSFVLGLGIVFYFILFYFILFYFILFYFILFYLEYCFAFFFSCSSFFYFFHLFK